MSIQVIHEGGKLCSVLYAGGTSKIAKANQFAARNLWTQIRHLAQSWKPEQHEIFRLPNTGVCVKLEENTPV